MKTAKIHFLFWFTYFWYAFISDKIVYGADVNLSTHILYFVANNLFLFYSILFFLRHSSAKSVPAFLKSVLLLAAILIVYFLLRYLVRFKLVPLVSPVAVSTDFHLTMFLTLGILWVVDYFFLAAAYFYFDRSVKDSVRMRKLDEENRIKEMENARLKQEELIREKEKVAFEYAYLRAQINPHFLYNTLDYLYSKSLRCSEELSEAILMLSEIFRYSAKSEDANGLVLLSVEIKHIKNIIQMNRLRYNGSLNINFIVDGKIGHFRIIPLVLVTIVENILKHGELLDPAYPANINLQIQDDYLLFQSENKILYDSKVSNTGVGLENAKKRLDAVYGDTRYSMSIREENGFYSTNLSIQLER